MTEEQLGLIANAAAENGSFRDPGGYVFHLQNRILRTVTDRAAQDYEFLRDRGLLACWSDEGWLVGSEEVDPATVGFAQDGVRYIIEHPALPLVSYPYEWPFSALKAAALFHLDFQLLALDAGVSFSDASAYNVQFIGPRPIFIDVLSLRRYRPGEFWTGHRQFCEQFLNPLLLRAFFGTSHNAWYRGSLEGIPSMELAALLPLRRRLLWNVMMHVVLPARWQRQATAKGGGDAATRLRDRQLPTAAYRGMLKQMRRWIAKLQPRDAGPTIWSEYDETHTYAFEEEQAKHAFVTEFVARVRPNTVWDLGCNTGEYAEVALQAGAERVIGFDVDHGALEKAFARARARSLDLLPLHLDAANPSPGQGWNGAERKSLNARANADMILALALIHHLMIGRNLPLPQVVAWLVELAPRGVIEFIQKTDPMVRQMLALREDVFENYAEDAFAAALGQHARIVETKTISAAGRRLYAYERS